MTFTEELQQLPVFQEDFRSWLWSTHKDFMRQCKMNEIYFLTNMPFSFQLGVFLEFLDSTKVDLRIESRVQGLWEYEIKLPHNARINERSIDESRSKLEAYQAGILEAFKILSK